MDLTLWGQIDELAWLCESLSRYLHKYNNV